MSDFSYEAPEILKDYLYYLQTIKGKSTHTVDEYYSDIRLFLRYIKLKRKTGGSSPDEISQIKIDDIDLGFIKSITLTDAYEFMNYLRRDRNNNASTRARKTSAIKGFFNFLTVKKNLLEKNPLESLDRPKEKKSLPKYLTLEQSIELLNAVDGKFKERDYCILTFFLNCGMRLSELVGLNYTDIRSDNTARIVGKGNKERLIYLNSACISAYQNYMKVRPTDGLAQADKYALFLSSRNRRISREMVQKIVYKYLEKIGLNAQGYSVHKLRHTAATLMYQNGNVDIRVLKEILGHENLGTTEIYTHLNTTQMEQAANANPLSKVKSKK